MVKSSDSRPTQTWFISSPATSELCDVGHRGLGKCWGQERHSQPRGSPGKLSHGVRWPGYIRGTAQQPLCLASSNRDAGSSSGSFWSFQKCGILSEGRWHKASYSVSPWKQNLNPSSAGERQGRVVGRPGALQPGCSGFEPQHPHCTVICTPGLVFSSENGTAHNEGHKWFMSGTSHKQGTQLTWAVTNQLWMGKLILPSQRMRLGFLLPGF